MNLDKIIHSAASFTTEVSALAVSFSSLGVLSPASDCGPSLLPSSVIVLSSFLRAGEGGSSYFDLDFQTRSIIMGRITPRMVLISKSLIVTIQSLKLASRYS